MKQHRVKTHVHKRQARYQGKGQMTKSVTTTEKRKIFTRRRAK